MVRILLGNGETFDHVGACVAVSIGSRLRKQRCTIGWS